jgi:hypothetical protein
MIITRKQLQLFEHLAKHAFIDTPANLQFADDTPLTPPEFRQFVMLRAALSVLKSMDAANHEVTIDLVEPFKS